MSAKNEDDESIVYEINLKTILENCKKYEINDFSIPAKMYYPYAKDIITDTQKTQEEINQHIKSNKILMYDVPDFLNNIPKMYFNCFDNSLFHFCKFLYKTDVKKIYEKIVKLKRDFNFLLSEIYEMSPQELDIFLKK